MTSNESLDTGGARPIHATDGLCRQGLLAHGAPFCGNAVCFSEWCAFPDVCRLAIRKDAKALWYFAG